MIEAIGRLRLRLPVDEFWELTLAQLYAMFEQYEIERDFALVLNARLMWASFASMGSKKKGGGRWSLRDFMPKRMRTRKTQTADPNDVEGLLAMAKHLNAMSGGRDLTGKK